MKESTNDRHDFQQYYPYNIADDSCGIPNRDAVIEQYMAGRLSENERDAFDEHTFYCNACFSALQFHEDLQTTLKNIEDQKKTAAQPKLVPKVIRHSTIRQRLTLLPLAALVFSAMAMYYLVNFVFVSEFSGSGLDTNVWSVAIDGNDHLIITGEFEDTLSFSDQKFVSGKDGDIFLVRFDASGKKIWAKHAGGSGAFSGQNGENQGLGVVTDDSSNLIVTGKFIGEVDFDGVRLKSSGPNENLFVAKYAENGTLRWIKQASASYSVFGHDVTTDHEGNVFACGQFAHHNLHGTATFDSLTVETRGGTDLFLVKYSENGQIRWLKTAGSDTTPGGDVARAVATDAFGNVIIAGQFPGKADFAGDMLKSAGDNDIFIAKYNPEGSQIFAIRSGGKSRDEAFDVAVDADNNILITGFFSGKEAFFEDVRLENLRGVEDEMDKDGFLAKYDENGRLLWVNPIQGVFQRLAVRGLAVDGRGNSFVIAHFTGEISFPDIDQPFNSGSGDDVLIAKFSSDGKFAGAIQIEGNENIYGMGVITDRRGDVYAAGSYEGEAIFDNAVHFSIGGRSIFLVKLEELQFTL